tara:strand:+ start:217 stop:1212 length:996 start_codon:yes stop_codon:yes gene_type:complete
MIIFIVDCQNGNGHLARSIALASKLKSLSDITLIGKNIDKKYIYKISFIKFINTKKNIEDKALDFVSENKSFVKTVVIDGYKFSNELKNKIAFLGIRLCIFDDFEIDCKLSNFMITPHLSVHKYPMLKTNSNFFQKKQHPLIRDDLKFFQNKNNKLSNQISVILGEGLNGNKFENIIKCISKLTKYKIKIFFSNYTAYSKIMSSKFKRMSKSHVLINANNFIFSSEIKRSKLIICSSSTSALETYYYKKIIFPICTVPNQEKIFEAFQKNLDYKGINFCNEKSLLKFMINFNNYKKKTTNKSKPRTTFTYQKIIDKEYYKSLFNFLSQKKD